MTAQTSKFEAEVAENSTPKRKPAERPVIVQFQQAPAGPGTLNTEFSSGDFEKIKKALRQIVLEHNGWIDPDTDEPMPPATEDGFWDLLAQEEVLLCLRAVGAARKKVLSSLLETPTV